jgi:glycosyltransferase involved in cell wall biosynthesis
MPATVVLNGLAVSGHHVGGALEYVVQLARHIDKVAAGLRVKVLMQRDALPVYGEQLRNLVPLNLPFAARSRTARVLFEQLLAPYMALSLDADLLHAPVNVAPFVLPCPLVLTVHECEPFKGTQGLPGHVKAWWLVSRRWSVRKAELIFAPSAATMRDLSRYMNVPEDRVVVTPLGVDHSQFWPDEAAGAMLRERLGHYFLWIGVPYPRKNLPTLLRAFARLSNPEVKLLLVGPKEWINAVTKPWLSKLGIGDRVIFAGRLSVPELRAALSGSVALVAPSLEEGFGLPALEAMACGTPVIANDIPAFREVAGPVAMLVDATSVECLRNAMERMLEDAQLRRLVAERGIQRAADFTWLRTAQLTAVVYRRILRCMWP